MCNALVAKTVGERCKGVLSDDEIDALNIFLREEMPKRREHLTELHTVDRGAVGVREAG